jgi:hypothetical protein
MVALILIVLERMRAAEDETHFSSSNQANYATQIAAV